MRRPRNLVLLSGLAGLLAATALLPARQPARATVSRIVAESVVLLADQLRLEGMRGGVREIRINGVALLTEFARSERRPGEILDELEALAELERGDGAAAPATEPSELEEISRALRRPQRLEGEHWGAYVRLVAGPADRETDVLRRFAEGEGLGPDAEGAFALLALRPPGAPRTDVVVLRFSEAFSPLALLPGEEGDVGGGDPPGIDRFPGSRRSFRFEERGVFGRSDLVAYEGGGSPAERARFYAEHLRRAGLEPLAEPAGDDRNVLLHFAGPDREVVVFSSYDPARDGVIDLIQMRSGS